MQYDDERIFYGRIGRIAVSAAVLALAGCSDGGGNKASPVSGTVDMTRMTADEVKTAIGAALDAGITEFKLTGEFAKIGIPARVLLFRHPSGRQPFYDSGVEKIDLTGVTDWPEVNVNGRVDDDFNFPPGDVRGLPARAFDGQKYDNGAFHYAYPALREVRLPAGVKALGCLAFFACPGVELRLLRRRGGGRSAGLVGLPFAGERATARGGSDL